MGCYESAENQPQEFYFIVIHLLFEDDAEDLRVKSVQAIAKLVEEKQYTPAILTGDFNARPDAACLDELRKNWIICKDINPALSFPADTPGRLIDYVCLYPANAFRILEHSVIDERIASDHRPIVTILDLIP